MPICITLSVERGVRIDKNDIWTLRRMFENRSAAEFFFPGDKLVTLRHGAAFRAGPDLLLSLQQASDPASIFLVVKSYVPLIRRHPPRLHHFQPRKPRRTFH